MPRQVRPVHRLTIAARLTAPGLDANRKTHITMVTSNRQQIPVSLAPLSAIWHRISSCPAEPGRLLTWRRRAQGGKAECALVGVKSDSQRHAP